MFSRISPRPGKILGQFSRPGPEVLHVGEDQVYHAQVGSENFAHIVDELLEDVIYFGLYRAQALCFSPVFVLCHLCTVTYSASASALPASSYKVVSVSLSAETDRCFNPGGYPSRLRLESPRSGQPVVRCEEQARASGRGP